MMKRDSKTKTNILSLLAELPPESVLLVEQFARFLREQKRQGGHVETPDDRVPYLYPTVTAPASSLDKWASLIPSGNEGNALEDSESLYDES